VFRGHEITRIDDKGRLKVPNVFRSLLESKYGREVFLTSLTGEYVRLFPMPVWVDLEEKLAPADKRAFLVVLPKQVACDLAPYICIY